MLYMGQGRRFTADQAWQCPYNSACIGCPRHQISGVSIALDIY